jgi:L-iditol 2-dehydrogenase
MKAIQAMDVFKNIHRYLLAKTVGAVYQPAFWGPLALLQYREVPEPALPGPQWVKIKTRYGGICGSDMNAVFLDFNLALARFVSFPLILGHENVGIIVQVGQEVEGFAPGDRVVVDPLLPCAPRGIEPRCEFCQREEFSLCQNFTAGALSPGFGIGFCRDTGGSWGPYFVAHQSQLYRVPDNVSDENALMVEPCSAPLRAVMRNFPDDDHTVLVLGAGTAGLCIVAALRALGSRARVIVIAKYPFQGEMAQRFGADEVIYLGKGDYLQAVVEATGGELHKAVLGKRFVAGGVDIVYECVGSKSSVEDSLRLARSGGTVVLLGMAAILNRVDWTPIWLKELTVTGTVWGGPEMFRGQRIQTFKLILEWMAEGKLNLAPMVTHRFRPDDYKRALAVTANKGRYRVIKSVFEYD